MLDIFRENYYKLRGHRLLSRGEFQKAYHFFSKALLINDTPQNVFVLALTLLSMGRVSEADKYLTKIKEHFKDNEIFLTTYAECKTLSRNWEEAKDVYNSLLNLFPNNPVYTHYINLLSDPVQREKYTHIRELITKSDKLSRENNNGEALKCLQSADEIAPNNALILNNIGSLLLSMRKEPEKILTYFRRACEIEPANVRYKKNLLIASKVIKRSRKSFTTKSVEK